MSCYKSGGCGVYEMYSCSECPASKPEYLERQKKTVIKEQPNTSSDENEDGVVLAKDIDDCLKCPLYESECPGGWTSDGAGNPIEPPCTSWNEDDEIWDGMLESQRIEWEESEERQRKYERSMKAKRAAKTRKKYSHLDDKYARFKEWLPKSRWNLIVTSRKLNKVYMRTIFKHSANYYFNLETERFHVVRGNISLADRNVMNQFENDFKEMFYGKRPKDRDFVKERKEEVDKIFKECFGFDRNKI